MSLIDLLKSVPDFRARRGIRHPLWLVRLCIILGAMMGYWGYRPLAEFVEDYGSAWRAELDLSDEMALPSYSTFRRVMNGLEFEALSQRFNEWAIEHVPIQPGEWVGVDGKSIKSTVTSAFEQEQNFVALVSVFSHKRGLVHASQAMENKHDSEINVVRELLARLDLSQVGVTMDALHCQKNTEAAEGCRQSLFGLCQGESGPVV